MTMQDLLDRDAETWQPEAGESKTGTVVSITEWQNEYDPYPVLDFDDENGKAWKLHCYHSVIKNEIARQRPQRGDSIGIKYFGEVDTKPGSKYKSYQKYTVIVEKANGEVPDAPNYDQYEEDAKASGVDEYNDSEAVAPTPAPAPAPTTVDGAGDPF